MFEDNEQGTEVELKILDLPYLYKPSDPDSQNFIKALSKVKNPHIFKSTAIDSILTYRW